MKVLVTGSEGYIGSVLNPLLGERKFDVVGLDTGYYNDHSLYQRDTSSYIHKDIRKIKKLDPAGFDAVVRLAELSNDPLDRLSPATTFNINFCGTLSLARICKKVGVQRFIYTSSCSVYGVGKEKYYNEDSCVDPQTKYARCKILSETDLLALANKDFSPVKHRNATACMTGLGAWPVRSKRSVLTRNCLE